MYKNATDSCILTLYPAMIGSNHFFFFCSLWDSIYLVSCNLVKILQATLQQYVNRELPDVQAGFGKGRGTRDQIANIRWIMEKAREF